MLCHIILGFGRAWKGINTYIKGAYFSKVMFGRACPSTYMWCFASITLCAIYCWTSSWTKVTSVNSWGFQSFPNCQCHLSGFECSLPLLRLNCELHIKLSVYKSESENINAKYKWYISILLFGFKAKIQIQTNTALFTSWLLCTTLPYAQSGRIGLLQTACDAVEVPIMSLFAFLLEVDTVFLLAVKVFSTKQAVPHGTGKK